MHNKYTWVLSKSDKITNDWGVVNNMKVSLPSDSDHVIYHHQYLQLKQILNRFNILQFSCWHDMKEYSYSLEKFIFIPAYHPFVFIHSLWLSSVFQEAKRTHTCRWVVKPWKEGKKKSLQQSLKDFHFHFPKWNTAGWKMTCHTLKVPSNNFDQPSWSYLWRNDNSTSINQNAHIPIITWSMILLY